MTRMDISTDCATTYYLSNVLRRSALPESIKSWPLTSVPSRLIKKGAHFLRRPVWVSAFDSPIEGSYSAVVEWRIYEASESRLGNLGLQG